MFTTRPPLATRLLRDSQPGWLTERLKEPGADNIPALAAARDLKFICALARERDKQLGYFEVSAHRMRYSASAGLGGRGVASGLGAAVPRQ